MKKWSLEESADKDQIRMSFIDRWKKISQSNPSLILTLPGPKKLDAILFRQHFPTTPIIGLERDPALFEILLNNPGLAPPTQSMEPGHPEPFPLIPYHATIRQYANLFLKSQKDDGDGSNPKTLHHSIIFLDYFGHYDSKKLDDIVAIVSNTNIVHPGKKTLLGVTFQKSQRNGRNAAIKDLKLEAFNEDPSLSVDGVNEKLSSEISLIKDSLINAIEPKEYRNPKGITMYFIMYEFC
jgi:hypothetical protein